MLAQFEAELHERAWSTARRCSVATAQSFAIPPPRHVGMPILMLDVAVGIDARARIYAALAARAPAMLATVPAGDSPARDARRALGVTPAPRADRRRGHAPSLDAAAETLCRDCTSRAPVDETVEVVSAPGEMQECVEIARRILAEAARGVPFDRMAVALHAPGRYVPYLEEALARAAIPAYFARGATRPEPGGRALLALLACAAEHLSARRYAEYLSLAQVPDRIATGARSFVAPTLELAPAPRRPTV